MARIKKHVVFPVYGYHAKTRDVIMIESQEFGKIVRVMQLSTSILPEKKGFKILVIVVRQIVYSEK